MTEVASRMITDINQAGKSVKKVKPIAKSCEILGKGLNLLDVKYCRINSQLHRTVKSVSCGQQVSLTSLQT